MKSLEYVKEHINEFEEDSCLDSRFTKRFMEFLPSSEFEKFGYKYTGEKEWKPKEWTEENIIEQLKNDTIFGYIKSVDERGISSELMAGVVRGWLKVLEDYDLVLNYDNDGYYHIKQFVVVADKYGWNLGTLALESKWWS